MQLEKGEGVKTRLCARYGGKSETETNAKSREEVSPEEREKREKIRREEGAGKGDGNGGCSRDLYRIISSSECLHF